MSKTRKERARAKLERKTARGLGFSNYAARKLEKLKDAERAVDRPTVPTKDDLKNIENPEEVKYALVKDTNTMYVYTGVGEGIGEVDGWSEIVIGAPPEGAGPEQLLQTYAD